MTLTTRGTHSASRLPAPGAGQSPENRQEQILVHQLLADVVEALTDRSGDVHEFPWAPDQQVRIGVLGPTYIPQAQQQGQAQQQALSGTATVPAGTTPHPTPPATPIDNRGVVGLDFVVKGGVSEVSLTFDVEYALYHPLIPSFDKVQRDAQTQAQAAAGNRRRRPTVAVRPSWVRDNRRVTYSVKAPVKMTGSPFLSSAGGSCPFELDARDAVNAHYSGADALWKLHNRQTVPVADALGSEAQFRQALATRRDPGWQPQWPLPELSITTTPTVEGDIAVSVSLVNRRIVTDKFGDLGMYDVHMVVHVDEPCDLMPQRLSFADDDLRYEEAATVPGRGRGCAAVAPLDDPRAIVADTLPIVHQHQMQPCSHGVDLRFSSIADNYQTKLPAIGTAMRAFLRHWDVGEAAGEKLAQLEQLRVDFEAETERFELGCDLLARDQRLSRAFKLMNRAFAAARGTGAGWFLFQLVFIVSQLGALAGRENPADPQLRRELDSVDVLWFPTGGGKTEAYLGLILVGLFFDRLRGKERGASAWVLFPLRMLSVQQLARISKVVYQAELLRTAEALGGDEFSMGYLVGKANTPNRLARPDGWWPGLSAFAARPEEQRDKLRLIGECPACGDRNSVGIDVDPTKMRLLHVCRHCGHVLGVYMSDEEVYRYQPSVVVSTVDKVTAFSLRGEFTAFNRGPRKRCPQHGWYTHDACLSTDCQIDPATHTGPVGFLDPTPALWIQDELHLVREDLGVFASHYHTLIAELARGAGHEPSKVIAATATIEEYQDQLSQVYGRYPRMFPVGGPALARSFYTEQTPNIRRVYLGILPAGGGTAKVDLGGIITCQLVEGIHRLMDDPGSLMDAWESEGLGTDTTTTTRERLLDYELALAYVNSKAHGVAVFDDLHRLSETLRQDGTDRVKSEYLMGETPLGELAGIVAEVQSDTLAVPRAERIRALVGTAVVSHGVDLDRLNFEVMVGMPSDYATYIQAASRAGRSHVGTVISIFDRNNRRETSMYQSFVTMHQALDRMVEPVPVNRFATRAVERTLPGIVCALLWDETRNSAWPSVKPITLTRQFRPWWNQVGAGLEPKLRDRIAAAYRSPVPLTGMAIEEQRLVDSALWRWDVRERQHMIQWQADYLTELFTSGAMTSLRDVDPPVFFMGGPKASAVAEMLTRA